MRRDDREPCREPYMNLTVGETVQPWWEEMAAAEWPSFGGKMGALIRSIDWSQTPLGPVDSWPPVLRSTVSLCLASEFPALIWGRRNIQIYNDAYAPICGARHPDCLGMDFTKCWAPAWPAGRSPGHRPDRVPGWTTSAYSSVATGTWRRRSSPFRSARSATKADGFAGYFTPLRIQHPWCSPNAGREPSAILRSAAPAHEL